MCTKTKNIHLNCKQNKIFFWKWQNVDLKWRSGTKRHPERKQTSCMMNGYSNPHCDIQDAWLSKTKSSTLLHEHWRENKKNTLNVESMPIDIWYLWQDCYLLDQGGIKIFIWKGKKASKTERAESLKKAEVSLTPMKH